MVPSNYRNQAEWFVASSDPANPRALLNHMAKQILTCGGFKGEIKYLFEDESSVIMDDNDNMYYGHELDFYGKG